MAKERENMFAVAAAKRKASQANIEASLLNQGATDVPPVESETVVEVDDIKTVKTATKKVKCNVCLDVEVKEMLERAAAKRHCSIATVVTSLILDNL